MRTLRDYQQAAVDAVYAEWAAGVNRTAIVLPTGSGKTDCIAKIATDEVRAGGRVLAVAHRSELLDQIAERCKMHAPDIPVGRVQAERNETRRPITVAMSQTLASVKRRAKLLRPTMMICDEAHHAASPSQMAILQWGGAFEHVRTLGVTATMARGDRRGLGDVWSSIAYQKSLKWAVEQGWLVPPRGRAVVVSHMDLSRAKISHGDYQDNELGDLVSQDVDEIVKAWSTHGEDRPTIAFTPNVQSAHDLANEFLAQGIGAEVVIGTTSHDARRGIYDRVARRETCILVNVMVATEGFDLPALSCALMCRPTRSAPLYQQMVGRVLRKYPGKDSALVLDVVGASHTQRLITLIELHETAQYDSSEVDVLPCDECGGAPRGTPLTENAPFGCTCAALAPPEELAAPAGPVTYVDIDLFETSKLNWLFTRQGIRFLPVGARMAILWPEPDGRFLPGHATMAGREADGTYVGRDGHWHPDGPAELHIARELAEHWARVVDPSVALKTSSWRKAKLPPTDAQLRKAERLGIEGAEKLTRPQLSDEISIVLASRILERA